MRPIGKRLAAPGLFCSPGVAQLGEGGPLCRIQPVTPGFLVAQKHTQLDRRTVRQLLNVCPYNDGSAFPLDVLGEGGQTVLEG
ncbi:hypothetical protein RKD49_000085 [Streptomyces glaucescens]